MVEVSRVDSDTCAMAVGLAVARVRVGRIGIVQAIQREIAVRSSLWDGGHSKEGLWRVNCDCRTIVVHEVGITHG